jgi:hypothetical protein
MTKVSKCSVVMVVMLKSELDSKVATFNCTT